MTKDDEGKKVKIISVDSIDESRAIQIGDLGDVESYEDGITCILLKTGLAKGSIYFLDENQLKVME